MTPGRGSDARAETALRRLVLWRVLDGKPGHENQTAGLVRALAARASVETFEFPAPARRRAWIDLLLGRCPAGRRLPPPDLLLGAGHATHPVLLACRRARGGRAVVLMRPSLPLRWFDLCVIPEHDGVPAGEGVFVSRGALNAVAPARLKRPGYGLILVGGPSPHHLWRSGELLAQIGEILLREPRDWVVATSRRTPAETEQGLRVLLGDRARLVTPQESSPGWLAGELALAQVAWVSGDSVSMLYEALTAGAACGVLAVPVRRPGRVTAGLERLLTDGAVTAFADWRAGQQLRPPAEPFNEAARCADWIMDRWFGV